MLDLLRLVFLRFIVDQNELSKCFGSLIFQLSCKILIKVTYVPLLDTYSISDRVSVFSNYIYYV